MGRHINDTGAFAHSSIALLQDRFKQLERVKVMREERELLRGAAAESERQQQQQQQRPNWLLQSELVRTLPTTSRALSAHLDRPEFLALETSLSAGFRHGRPAAGPVQSFADVDTSLHL